APFCARGRGRFRRPPPSNCISPVGNRCLRQRMSRRPRRGWREAVSRLVSIFSSDSVRCITGRVRVICPLCRVSRDLLVSPRRDGQWETISLGENYPPVCPTCNVEMGVEYPYLE